MLFDLHPKESRKELFGRDWEVDYVKRQVKAGNWVIIGGQRGVGKTSLLKVALNELSTEGFKVLYINMRGINTLRDLLAVLINRINESKLSIKLSASLNLVMGSVGLTLNRGYKVANSLLELFLSIKEPLVLGLDEVQEISRVSGQFLKILGNVFSSNPRVSFIFTGSYIGVARALLNPSPDSPLYGRPPVEVRLRPFSDELAREFLRSGFEELGILFNRFDEIVVRLDGVVGWLTLFGNYHGVRGLPFEEALKLTMSEGAKIMVSELQHFLEDKVNKALYLAILSSLKVANRWKDIKFAASVKLSREVGDRELTNALNALVSFGFIEKTTKGEYRIMDPLLSNIDYDELTRRYSGTAQ
ncbi:ATP-binding protein [Caldivirga sp.]|uniref:AAA family ATPase n=1 Tax=Caldivirga sp. TaxID=2080243 RepID=UPI0025BEF545|nr:ATP-binding protein [Caldivirga sp.]